MYGIGVFEIFIIFLVLLLFFRPKEIFSLFRRMGTWYNRIKNMEKELKKGWDFDSEPDDKDSSFGFDTDSPDGTDGEDTRV
jgi:Sec-independent protein translocase protein TatA